MNAIQKFTTFLSSKTEDDSKKAAKQLHAALKEAALKIEKQLEFLNYKKDAIRAPSTLTQSLKSGNYFEGLSEEDLEIIKEIDLFGALHLEAGTFSNEQITIALKKRKALNEFYKNWLESLTNDSILYNLAAKRKEIEDISNNTSIVNTAVKDNLSTTMTRYIMDSTQLNDIYKQILIETEVLYKIINNKQDLDIYLQLLTNSEDVIERILLDKNFQAIYLDLWISARAIEQSRSEFEQVTDKLSIAGLNYSSSKSLISSELEELNKDQRFEVKQGSMSLNSSQSESIKNSINQIFTNFTGEEERLKFVLQVINIFSTEQFKSILSLIEISPTKEELRQVIETENKNSDEKYMDINLVFMKIFKELESDSSEEARKDYFEFSKILSTLNSLYTQGMDVFIGNDKNQSIYSILKMLGKNVDLIYESYSGNLDGIHTRDFKQIYSRIENHFTNKLKILNELANATEENLIALRNARNQNLLKVIRRERKILDYPNDHQGYLNGLLNLIRDSQLLDNFSLEDYAILINLSVENFDNLESKLQSMLTEIFVKYRVFLNDMYSKGMKKDFKLGDLDNISTEASEKYSNFMEIISLSQLCGFCLIPQNDPAEIKFEFKKDIFESYLNGWEYIIS